MDKAKAGVRGQGIPEGYLAVPVSEADAVAPLRICVLVRRTPDPAAGSFILLRERYDARVYLGCVTDASGQGREWIELWVQNLDGLESTLPAHRETYSNFGLDMRWADQAAAFRELDPECAIQTGWESSHPLPAFLDISAVRAVHPGNAATGGHWELCRDDQLLRDANLPAYSTSLTRYLCQTAAGPETKFIPVVEGAPQNARTAPISTAIAGLDHHLAFNPQAGLMMALNFAPLSYEDYVDLLGGRPWPGIEHGKKRLMLDERFSSLNDAAEVQNGVGHLMLGAEGRTGRLLEGFHLKLQALSDAFRAVRGPIERHQLPFLNLSAESFRVSLKPLGTGLPFFWTAKTRLVKPTEAFALPVETSDFRYFIRARGSGTSIYLPEGLNASIQGNANARIRKILPPDQGKTILEGTLVCEENLDVAKHDLLWIRLPLPGGRVDLYGHLYAAESLAQGEVRFRTIAQKLPEPTVAALRAAEGVSFAKSPFEVVPLLSSPCDLYSLGVLAVRTLLVDDKTTLAIALDEVLSLGRRLAAPNANVPLGTRIREVLLQDGRYAESLGPHHLMRAGLSQPEAAALLPFELWCDTLGMVVSLFPGLGPDSVCRDYGDVPALALETVLNRPLNELDKLLTRSRSLILVDWRSNQEIRDSIERLRGS